MSGNEQEGLSFLGMVSYMGNEPAIISPPVNWRWYLRSVKIRFPQYKEPLYNENLALSSGILLL